MPGLEDVILRDKERAQPKASRPGLLLQEAGSNRRFEVESQVGKTDESHIAQTLEYWDVERTRHPQYDHTPMIVAEELTARFVNIRSPFNRAVPLIAHQMSAMQVNAIVVSLMFTTVLDQQRP